MAGISRVHGGVVAETLTGGYQTTYLLITGTNVGTADTGGAGSAITEGNFTKAIRALQTVATTVFIGPRGDNGFLVGLDGATAQPTGPAFDTDSSPTVAERVKAVLDTATGVTTTVTEKTLALAQFA
jgi:hypothetical protein